MKSLILAWIRGLERLAIFKSFREKSRFIVRDTTYYCVVLSGCVFGMDFATNTEGFTQHFHHFLGSLFIVYHKMIVLLLISPYGSHVCMGFCTSIVPLVNGQEQALALHAWYVPIAYV